MGFSRENHERVERLRHRLINHPGRGGCGVGAIADLQGKPSRDLIEWALGGLGALEHRGGSIDDTGDGAGLLFTFDRAFFTRFVAPGRHLPDDHALIMGVFFFPIGEPANLPHWQHAVDAALRQHGLAPLGWRRVPTDDTVLGGHARSSRRDVWQVLAGEGMVPPEQLDWTLHRVKAQLEHQIRDTYISSFSSRTVSYKALATSSQLLGFYEDLRNPELRTNAVIFHRRYSTNTFSNWYLSQVFRLLGHNGEINTIKANRNAVENLEAELGLSGVLMLQGSDSADMDRITELFVAQGISLPETLVRLMPMAWRDLPRLTPETVRFYQGIQRALGTLGAWEGPAAIVATDGQHLVAGLDRMGLRPLRYLVTRSRRLIVGSELGAIPVPFDDVAETGQLDPGEVMALRLKDQQLYRPAELLAEVVKSSPINFAELSENRLVSLQSRLASPPIAPAAAATPGASAPPATAPAIKAAKPDNAALNLFGFTQERVRTIRHMAENGKEPITSMGYDRPLPVFSGLRPPLAKYFKQIVAVVTNPPLDPIREGSAFDLTVHLGAAPEVHDAGPVWDPLPQYKLPSPFLAEDQFSRIRDAQSADRPSAMVVDATFADPGESSVQGAKAISRRIAEICRDVVSRIRRKEATIVILSDRTALTSAQRARPDGETEESRREPAPPARLPVPMILLTSAVHNAISQEGLRRRMGIVVETGEVQEGHDAAVLIGSGADAVFPYLFFQVGAPHGGLDKLVVALEETLRRVMSKMGICSVDGYRGARLFEAVGISPAVVEHYLPGVAARIGGIDLEDMYEDVKYRHSLGGSPQRDPDLSVYRKDVWNELQTTARGHDPEAFGRFLKLIEETPPVYIRNLLELVPAQYPTKNEDMASNEEVIAHVFRGAAMSHGALHRVAHRAIAAAFNRFGAMSNCGEGGEDSRRDRNQEWSESRSRIRQVASGRFGVDARYLIHADEISIKIGQGAKPGEGGMLPASKVTEEVAIIRKTKIGVTLISPPPHHDIYSIEDLAQLIFNLKQVNPAAKISVKIPAVTDIGTIAVGIAKAGAHVIDVSGFEGGTGAASASSIEHAGLPLERALAETHQALVLSGVRDRVRVRADGGIKTGFDVVAVLALGADEVSLGTSLMIAEQCIFCHGCANGFCPAGITTQSDLVARRLMTIKKGRAKDEALPDLEEERYQDAKLGVERYLLALADDVRRHLASLGLKHPSELVGQVGKLRRKMTGTPRQDKVDLSEILTDVSQVRESAGRAVRLPVDPTTELNARVVKLAADDVHFPVRNTDRAVGATLAGKIANGDITPSERGYTLRLSGYVGQALGFACTDGIRIVLDGFANDTVGEAMGGGTIVVRAPRAIAPAERGKLSLAGNAVGYGATGGTILVDGRVGQRVGVRNSGASIVVEGAGKYAFEYMTGGVGLVLGPVGPVVGSGLTGGVVYLLDDDRLEDKIHKDAKIVPTETDDVAQIRALLDLHIQATESTTAQALVGLSDTQLASKLRKVMPA